MQWEKDEIEREANRIASENELLDLRSPEVEGAHTSNSIDTGDIVDQVLVCYFVW
jgi:hypothetical protein